MLAPTTPYRITLLLAYCANYTPKFLPGRCFSPTHLQTLSDWLDDAAPTLRTIRYHPALSLNVTAAFASGLLSNKTGRWRVTSSGMEWLSADRATCLAYLLQHLESEADWESALAALGLTGVVTLDYRVYATQQLQRQQRLMPPPAPAKWLPSSTDEAWRFDLPDTLPILPLFHLLQMGDWLPDEGWTGTPYSIALAAQRGYGISQMEYVLTQAVGQPLTERQTQQLTRWYRLHDAYQIKSVYLLTVKQPERLPPILAHGLMKKKVRQQIGRRHAIVSPSITPGLRNWLAKRQIPLDAPDATSANKEGAADAGTIYLALNVLHELRRILPLEAPRIDGAMGNLPLTQAQRADAEHRAQRIVQGVKDAIRGRDAFFPMTKAHDEAVLAAIQKAMEADCLLTIRYQGLADSAPINRRVEPLRIEERGRLTYLHGYCHLAEDSRIFRLDRMHACEIVPGSARDKRRETRLDEWGV
ncbi:MAG: WYL domain-containing protein [Chloroflexi bacterium]|nr:WYL domain-containing protein [Chloroflexota bacterium]